MSCITEQDLNEVNIEIIRNTLYKVSAIFLSFRASTSSTKEYLESFYHFCESIGGATADVMCGILSVCWWCVGCSVAHVLQFEADRRAFNITINSFGTELTRDVRVKLYPTIGKLHPEGLSKLAECNDYLEVQRVAEFYPAC